MPDMSGCATRHEFHGRYVRSLHPNPDSYINHKQFSYLSSDADSSFSDAYSPLTMYQVVINPLLSADTELLVARHDQVCILPLCVLAPFMITAHI